MTGFAGFGSWAWIDAIGWALLHSLWQGVAVALVLAFVLGILRRATAQARYLAACAAMLLLLAPPVYTLSRSREKGSSATELRALHRALPRLEPSSVGEADGVSAHHRSRLSILEWTRPNLPTVVAIWTVGVAVFSIRLTGGWVQARRWVRLDTCPLAGALIGRLCERMGVRSSVALFESSRVAVPMVVGWLRPAILVPVAALSGLTPLEMEAILAHELAHIRRHDYLVNLGQCVIETLMFHHPATWWISRVIRREREHCCDDIAVRACRDRLVYARALAAMEGLRTPVFSLSPAASGGDLLARISRILKPVQESMKPVRMLLALVVVLAFVPIWLVRAGEKTEADPGSPWSELDANEPFQKTNGAGGADDAPSEAEVWEKVERRGHSLDAVNDAEAERTYKQSAYYKKVGKVASAKYYLGKVSTRWPNSPWSVRAKADLEEIAKMPRTPSCGSEAIDDGVDAEISKDRASFCKVERKNVRIVVEKICDKADPAKVYPLAGLCQLVHRHYKCTVYFDEALRADLPNAINHVEHKVEVVYIDKDFLRRADSPGPATTRVDRIDGIVREIERLKRELQSDRQDQERVLDGLIKELESLKKRDVETQRTRQ
jgi:beta-lactamase regulating signal transducer with metallopeptidase domain